MIFENGLAGRVGRIGDDRKSPSGFDIAAAARKAASVFRFSWPSLAGRMHRRGNFPTAFGQRATMGGR